MQYLYGLERLWRRRKLLSCDGLGVELTHHWYGNHLCSWMIVKRVDCPDVGNLGWSHPMWVPNGQTADLRGLPWRWQKQSTVWLLRSQCICLLGSWFPEYPLPLESCPPWPLWPPPLFYPPCELLGLSHKAISAECSPGLVIISKG